MVYASPDEQPQDLCNENMSEVTLHVINVLFSEVVDLPNLTLLAECHFSIEGAHHL